MNKQQAQEAFNKLKSDFETNSKRLQEIIDKPEITPKQRLLELIKGCEIDFDFEKYPEAIFYKKDGKYMLELDFKNGRLWCSYKNIWSIFETEFSMNYHKIQSFIKETVEEHFKWKGLTPNWQCR